MHEPRVIGRRNFIRYGFLAAAAIPSSIREYCVRGSIVTVDLAVNPRRRHQMPHFYGRPVLDPNRLAHFVDPLPIMPLARPAGWHRTPNDITAVLYKLRMTEFHHKVHRDLPPTRVWGFNESVPGPTFDVRCGSPVMVEWTNALPAKHFLPIDSTIHGAEKGTPEVRTVVHLHGAKAPPESDGYPEDWYTPGNSAVYFYPNQQRAATLWYHDHALGIVRLNNLAGLSGVYILRDAVERRLRLPRGDFEIPLVIQDRTFDPDGQLNYPTSGQIDRIWIPDFFGNAVLVNGKVYPYLEVQPRKYRFRLLNASNARFYALTFSSGQQFYQIGSDQGLLAAPAAIDRLLIAPSERADVIVDFAPYAGQQIVLHNDAAAPYPAGGMVVPQQLMQFRVNRRARAKDRSTIPPKLAEVERIDPALAVRSRDLRLIELSDAYGRTKVDLLNYSYWNNRVTENPIINTIEIWNLVNNTGDAHPIHIHLISFQVIGRRPFDPVKMDRGQTVYTGPMQPPPPNEAGWKDTVRSDPGYVTTIIAKFEGYTGRYVWHCHILEHEDNEMMRPYEVLAADQPARILNSDGQAPASGGRR
jgi:spore coat protein A